MNYKETMNELSKGHVFGKDPISLESFQAYMNFKNNIQKQLNAFIYPVPMEKALLLMRWNRY